MTGFVVQGHISVLLTNNIIHFILFLTICHFSQRTKTNDMTKYCLHLQNIFIKRKHVNKNTIKKSTELDKFPILCNISWIEFMS